MAIKVTQKQLNEYLKSRNVEKGVVSGKLRSGDGTVIPVEVKTTLTNDEIDTFIMEVANSCFDADGSYRSYYLHTALRVAACKYLTDLPLPKVPHTDNIDIGKALQLSNDLHLMDEEQAVTIYGEQYAGLIALLIDCVTDQVSWMQDERLAKIKPVSTGDVALMSIVELADEIRAIVESVDKKSIAKAFKSLSMGMVGGDGK